MATATRELRATPAQPQESITAKPSPLATARAFGVVLGLPLLLDLVLLGSAAAIIAGGLARPASTRSARLLRRSAALGTVAPVVYLLVGYPWQRRWGATDEETRKRLPGDDLVPDPAMTATRAVTAHAPVEAVWPWLAQIGQDRGGFYSYEWLENLAGCEMRNADRIHPEWQQRAVGDTVRLHPSFGLQVSVFEPQHAIGLEGWGTFVLQPIGERSTRLIARERTPRTWGALAAALLWELPHFIMERKMLLGIKERAERAWANGNAGVGKRGRQTCWTKLSQRRSRARVAY